MVHSRTMHEWHLASVMCLDAGTKSQSTKCVKYDFAYDTVTGKRVRIHVIDTPGLSDTEGLALMLVCHDFD